MISAVITAAGSSERFGTDKMTIPVGGQPLIMRTIQPFIEAGIEDIIVVTKDIKKYRDILGGKISIVEGGESRIGSILNGVKKAKGDIIITHDGARPLLTRELLESLIVKVTETGAAMTAVNPTATVKVSDGSIISETLPRKTTWIAQTPQGYTKPLIIEALTKALQEKYLVPTDDSEIVQEMTGHKVHIVEGDHMNIKVTHPGDEIIANALWRIQNENRNR